MSDRDILPHIGRAHTSAPSLVCTVCVGQRLRRQGFDRQRSVDQGVPGLLGSVEHLERAFDVFGLGLEVRLKLDAEMLVVNRVVLRLRCSYAARISSAAASAASPSTAYGSKAWLSGVSAARARSSRRSCSSRRRCSASAASSSTSSRRACSRRSSSACSSASRCACSACRRSSSARSAIARRRASAASCRQFAHMSPAPSTPAPQPRQGGELRAALSAHQHEGRAPGARDTANRQHQPEACSTRFGAAAVAQPRRWFRRARRVRLPGPLPGPRVQTCFALASRCSLSRTSCRLRQAR